jgi:type IV secretory pathway VirB6-like protein
MNRFIQLLFCISLLSLSSCTSDMCIDAEDFGFESVDISSRYSQDELLGERDRQVGPWRKTTLVSNGKPIMIIVKDWKFKRYSGYRTSNNPQEISAWSPWYGGSGDGVTLSPMNERLPVCQITGNNMCTNTTYLQVSNPPCIFTKGVGLYALLTATDPNANESSMKYPTGLSFHLGDPHPSYNLYHLGEPAGGILFKYTDQNGLTASQLRDQYAGTRLYLKILDSHYKDNSGQYKVIIKSGADYAAVGPIGKVLEECKRVLFGSSSSDRYGLVKNIYNGILNDSRYQSAVRSLLVLYIMFSGLGFLVGTVNVSHTEFAIRVIKICFITVMMNSAQSWSFFHDYLFVFFIEGVDEISNKFIGQDGSSSSLAYFDTMLSLMLGVKTMAKLSSLLFTTWFGFIFIIVYLALCFGYMWIMMKAVVLYLTSIIFIGLIITMAPIFLCFSLFNVTKSLFDNWLKQLVSYTLQPIILIVGLSMAGVIIRHEIYTTLGFTVCKKGLFDMGAELFAAADEVLGSGTMPSPTSFLYWWFPKRSPSDFCNSNSRYDTIPVPEDYVQSDGTYCAAYACSERRCIDMPFINLNDPLDVSKLDMIKGSGSITLLHSLIIFFLMMYLLKKYNDASETIAKSIAGTSMSSTTSASGVSQAFSRALGGAMSKAMGSISDRVGMRIERGYNRIKKGMDKELSRTKANMSSALGKVGDKLGSKFTAAKEKMGARLSNISNKFQETDFAKKISGSAIGSGIYTAGVLTKTSLVQAGTVAAHGVRNLVENVNFIEKIDNVGLKKTAGFLGYLKTRSPIGMTKDLVVGVFKAARFLAVHRVHGLQYIAKEVARETIKDLAWVGKAPIVISRYGIDKIKDGWAHRSANIDSFAHLQDPSKADRTLLSRAEKISKVSHVELTKSQKELSDLREKFKKHGFKDREINALINGKANSKLQARFENINKKDVETLKTRGAEVKDRNQALRKTYAELLYLHRNDGKALKVGESNKLAAEHFADINKMRGEDLANAERKVGIKFDELSARQENISKLAQEKTAILDEIAKNSGLNDKDLAKLQAKLGSLEENVSKRLQEMKKANPKLDMGKARASLEKEMLANIIIPTQKKDQPNPELIKIATRYTNVSNKYQVERKALSDNSEKLQKAYASELAVREVPTNKQKKARKDEQAYLRGDAIQSKIEFIKYKLSGGTIGYEWHEGDENDKLKRSYAEKQDDRAKELKLQEINGKIAERLTEEEKERRARAKDPNRKPHLDEQISDNFKYMFKKDGINSLMAQKRAIEFELEMKDKFGSMTALRAMKPEERKEVYSKVDAERKDMIDRAYGDARKNAEFEVRSIKDRIHDQAGIAVSDAKIREIYKLNLDEGIPKTATGYDASYTTRLEGIIGKKLTIEQAREIKIATQDLEKVQNELKSLRKQEAKLTEVSLDYMDRLEGKKMQTAVVRAADHVRKFGGGVDDLTHIGSAAKYVSDKIYEKLPSAAKRFADGTKHTLNDINDKTKFSDERRAELLDSKDLRGLDLKMSELQDLQDKHLKEMQVVDKFKAREEKALGVRVENISKNFDKRLDKISDKASEEFKVIQEEKISAISRERELVEVAIANKLAKAAPAAKKRIEKIERVGEEIKFIEAQLAGQTENIIPERRERLEAIRDLSNLENKYKKLENLREDNVQKAGKDWDKIIKLEGELKKFAEEEQTKLDSKLGSRIEEISHGFEQSIKRIEEEQLEYVKSRGDNFDQAKLDEFTKRIDEANQDKNNQIASERSKFEEGLEDQIANKAHDLGIDKAYEDFGKAMEAREKKVATLEKDIYTIEEKLSAVAAEMGYVEPKIVDPQAELDKNIARTDFEIDSLKKEKAQIQQDMDNRVHNIEENEKKAKNTVGMTDEEVAALNAAIEKDKHYVEEATKKILELDGESTKLSNKMEELKQQQERSAANMLETEGSMDMVKSSGSVNIVDVKDTTNIINSGETTNLIDATKTGGQDVVEGKTQQENLETTITTIKDLKSDLADVKSLKQASTEEKAQKLEEMQQKGKQKNKERIFKKIKDKLFKKNPNTDGGGDDSGD